MSGPKRNPDKLNTIGVVVVGICGAVLVYVTIVALQAFYVNDTSEIQTMADYKGQDTAAKTRKAEEMRNISEVVANAASPGMPPTYRIDINTAMQHVVNDAKTDPAHLVPALPKSEKPTIEPVFGRPKAAPPAAPAGMGSGAPQTQGATVPTSPTGTPGEPQPVAGAGGAPAQGSAGSAAPNAGSAAPTGAQTGSATGSAAPQAGSGAGSATAPKQPAPKQPKKQPKAPKATGGAGSAGSAQPTNP